jgi:hypothetical protein
VFARVLATFALVVGTVSAGSTDTELVVYLKTGANQPAAPVTYMKRELAALMMTAGYRVQWGEESADSVLTVVELNGTCTMPSGFDATPSASSGASTGVSLATTNVTDGQVLPFSAVNCAVLTRSLAPVLLKDAGAQRDFLYGRAMARVVAHELYHILMRTTEHSRSGVARSCFSTDDLLTERFEFESAVLAQMRRKPETTSAIAFTENSDR